VDKSIHILIIESGSHPNREFNMETASMIATGVVLFTGLYGLLGLLFRPPTSST
jgi:hypothetical protein